MVLNTQTALELTEKFRLFTYTVTVNRTEQTENMDLFKGVDGDVAKIQKFIFCEEIGTANKFRRQANKIYEEYGVPMVCGRIQKVNELIYNGMDAYMVLSKENKTKVVTIIEVDKENVLH